ncbi:MULTISPECIES: hypothetical protein [Chryseobacterium]|uniref:hypothetical protein n=1 Tax=Chryseobacterium TaxID=59732 RepID=UPI000FB8AF78|nr:MULTISPECIES: hypothetical protein [Chryseobacterium]MBM7418081.1 hypothetical protein [Chryseobacterium sp. JUb44]MDH6212284.1 hypothetical protein [Chryseobacterium sp. BIGb0186]WSO10897.1 hypothetical protein VUJ64_03000 [Chryseobacterium scophthalmum]
MKSLYIIAFLAFSLNIYAQQDKKSVEIQQAENHKESKEFEAKMMKEAQENTNQKARTGLASEQGLEVKEKQKNQPSENNSGKLLPNTASMEEILATIPGRASKKRNISKSSNDNIPKLPNTATLEEIKKTIPKN